jgi:hypothetical protein
MNRNDHVPAGQFGFARGAEAGRIALPAVERAPAPANTAPGKPVETHVDHSVVRPKAVRPEGSRPAPASSSADRRWLALGLAGMVYVVGVTGLWSMLETFRETAPRQITPARGTDMLPPVDDTADVRDALLQSPADAQSEARIPL